MAMSMDDGNGTSEQQTLAEINVTPFVDVMLVLLIIFMVTSSVETNRVEQQIEQIRRIQEEEVIDHEEIHPSQNVPIELPKVNAERVNLSEEQKLVLTMTVDPAFFIGDTLIVNCSEIKGGEAAKKSKKRGKKKSKKKDTAAADDRKFAACLAILEEKLLENEKLLNDGELYLRADRSIPYGRALTVMARIRKAGITKFGLVAETDLEE